MHANEFIYHTACRFWSLQCTLLPCGSVLVPGAMSLSCSLEPLRFCEQGTAACPGTVLGWQEPLHLSRHWNLHHLAIPLETWIVLTSYAVSWPPAWKSCTEPCAVWFPVVPSLPLMQPCSRTASLEAGKELPHQVTKGHSLFSTFPISLRQTNPDAKAFFPCSSGAVNYFRFMFFAYRPWLSIPFFYSVSVCVFPFLVSNKTIAVPGPVEGNPWNSLLARGGRAGSWACTVSRALCSEEHPVSLCFWADWNQRVLMLPPDSESVWALGFFSLPSLPTFYLGNAVWGPAVPSEPLHPCAQSWPRPCTLSRFAGNSSRNVSIQVQNAQGGEPSSILLWTDGKLLHRSRFCLPCEFLCFI